MPFSVVPLAFAISAGLLYAFYRVQRAKDRAGTDLVRVLQLDSGRRSGFRHHHVDAAGDGAGRVPVRPVRRAPGRATPVCARDTGLWLVPSGLAIVAGSQIGSWLTGASAPPT